MLQLQNKYEVKNNGQRRFELREIQFQYRYVKMEMRGIDPRTSACIAMLYHLSYIPFSHQPLQLFYKIQHTLK